MMLKQTDILKAVISLLKTKYPAETTKYYTDEITEGFKQPCFFVKLIKSRNTETKNVNSNNLSIILTFFADSGANRQLSFLDCEDNISQLFGNNFKAADRYLHVKSVSAERIGEEQDILQITVAVEYLDSTGYDPDVGYEIMQVLDIDIS